MVPPTPKKKKLGRVTLRKHQNGKAGMPEMPAVCGLVLLRVKIVGSHPRPSLTKRTAVLQTTSGPPRKRSLFEGVSVVDGN